MIAYFIHLFWKLIIVLISLLLYTLLYYIISRLEFLRENSSLNMFQSLTSILPNKEKGFQIKSCVNFVRSSLLHFHLSLSTCRPRMKNPLSKAACSQQKRLDCWKTLRTYRLLCAIFTWAPLLEKSARQTTVGQWQNRCCIVALESERKAPGSVQPLDALERIISSGILHYAWLESARFQHFSHVGRENGLFSNLWTADCINSAFSRSRHRC